MPTIQVEIVSAEKEIWSGKGAMVFAPGVVGELGIAPRHTPLLTRLKAGDVRVQQENGEQQFFFISGGILEVQPHLVTILSDTAIRAADLDQAAAEQAQQRAQEALQDQSASMDYAQAKAELANAVAQLRAIDKLRKIKG